MNRWINAPDNETDDALIRVVRVGESTSVVGFEAGASDVDLIRKTFPASDASFRPSRRHWVTLKAHQFRNLNSTAMSEEEWRPAAPTVALMERLFNFVSWGENWDEQGAKRVTPATASRVYRLLTEVIRYAEEPFVAPSGDGAIMMSWESDDRAVELFVSDQVTPMALVVTQGEKVTETLIDSSGALIAPLSANIRPIEGAIVYSHP